MSEVNAPYHEGRPLASRTRQVTMKWDRETTNTHKYEEEVSDDPDTASPPVIGSLYVKKWAVGKVPPARILVTIEPIIGQ